MKEKFIQINKIQGFEDIREWYWISNSDEDVIVNRNTGKTMKTRLDKYGYKRICLMTNQGKVRNCKIHIIKAKAFIYGPNPLGADQVRHLNDVKTDNTISNLAWGTRSDNTFDSIRNGHYNYEATIKGGIKGGKITGTKNGKKTGAKNGRKSAKKTSKPVRCIETGIIYSSASEAERQTGIHNASINHCCNSRYKTAGGFHWEFVSLISE